ncbi:MAG: tyrosine-type recombinase/integrase [Tepidisphaera sp.]|nr:tyrosine-type recombinase/integrase [Tepidisphaera sp.]
MKTVKALPVGAVLARRQGTDLYDIMSGDNILATVRRVDDGWIGERDPQAERCADWTDAAYRDMAAEPITTTKGRTFPVEVLTADEVERLMGACSRKAPTGIRNRALIALLYRTGLRISEALSLQPKDLDPERGTVRVLRGKGGKARTVGMDAGGFALLDKWMAMRPKSQWVFCTLDGAQVSDYYVRNMLPRIAEKAGIEKRVHPHGLRHTHAARLADERVPIHLIAAQLGHSNIGTTSRYIDHIAPGAVVAAVREVAWASGQ